MTDTPSNKYHQPTEQEWKEKLEQAQREFKLPRPNILICGYTGSGKTSLIKAILGDVVPENAIGTGMPQTQGFDFYENNLVRVYDSKGMENGETEEAFMSVVKDFIHQHQMDDPTKIDDHIHLVWYTIQGTGARVTDCDKKLIREIFTPKNLVVCITKADGMRENQKEAMKQAVLEAGVPAERIIFTTDEEGGSVGCQELMELSLKMLPNAYKDAFVEAQKVDKELKIKLVYQKSTKAKAIISAASAAAAGIGFVPIPGSDAPLLVADQTTMIASLAALYGIGYDAVKVGMLPFLAKVAGTTLASSLLKAIPGIGTIAGGAITATIAATLTGAMGMYVKNYFEKCAIAKINGEPLPEVPWNAELFAQYYKEYKANTNK